MSREQGQAAPPEFLSRARRPEVPSDKLVELTAKVQQAEVIKARIENGNQLLKELKLDLNTILMDEIPTMMNALGIPRFTVAGRGNEPPVEVKNAAFYSAGFPVKDRDPDRESKVEDMYSYLEEIGHDDLIKVEVTFLLPRGTPMAAVRKFVAACQKIKIMHKAGRKNVRLEILPPSIRKAVNTNTLTAWLRRQVEEREFIPDLKKINGFIGEKAEIKAVKEN